MSYLICEKCGKHYLLEEGKSSFYFERCDCGGKLKYSPTSNADNPLKENKPLDKIKKRDQTLPKIDWNHNQSNRGKNWNNNQPKHEINWKGILLGLAFLLISLVLSVLVLFGTDLPTNVSAISMKEVTIFSITTTVLTIGSGFISSYVSRSRKFREGALNGGLVGVILGLMLGVVGGLTVLVSLIALFGSLSMIGGIIGSFFRNKGLK